MTLQMVCVCVRVCVSLSPIPNTPRRRNTEPLFSLHWANRVWLAQSAGDGGGWGGGRKELGGGRNAAPVFIPPPNHPFPPSFPPSLPPLALPPLPPLNQQGREGRWGGKHRQPSWQEGCRQGMLYGAMPGSAPRLPALRRCLPAREDSHCGCLASPSSPALFLLSNGVCGAGL